MSVRKLDRNRKYGITYGDEAANPERPRKFYQDGMYFDGAGIAIEGSEIKVATLPPTNDPAEVVEIDDTVSDNIKVLKDLPIPKLKQMAEALSEATGLDLPEYGKGVKARLVKYIAENAE